MNKTLLILLLLVILTSGCAGEALPLEKSVKSDNVEKTDNAEKDYCENSGGVWAEGECLCGDGKTLVDYECFDSATVDTRCEETGGTIVDGSCECPPGREASPMGCLQRIAHKG